MSDDPEERDLLAAEYVLGLLAPDQARAAEALALHEPAFAASVGWWEDRLAPLADIVSPTPPPALLWRRLALATGIAEEAAHAPERLRRRLRVWRAATAAALAVAACLALLLLRPAEPPALLAVLAPAGGEPPAFILTSEPGGGAVIRAVAGPRPPAGRSFELWALPQGATAPVSLGVLPLTGERRIPLRTGPVVLSGTLLGG